MKSFHIDLFSTHFPQHPPPDAPTFFFLRSAAEVAKDDLKSSAEQTPWQWLSLVSSMILYNWPDDATEYQIVHTTNFSPAS